jgi:hypothetical protein
MVVIFTKQNSNYTQQNIIDVLSVINHPTINYLIHSQRDYIKVVGDIHRSQFTSDNPQNYFWFKIQGYMNDFLIPDFKAVHIYVCFRQMQFNYNTRQYVMGGCINPEGHTDIADISGLMGFWEFKKITFGLSSRNIVRQGNRRPVKKLPSKKLEIVDPKTGKAIQIGGSCGKSHQKGGNGEAKNKKNKKNNEYIYTIYSPEAEKFLDLLRNELKKAFKSIDFRTDPLSGKKLVKAHNEIIFRHLKELNKLRVDYPLSIEIINEIEQAIKNEHPEEYNNLKARRLRRIVYKVSKISPKNKVKKSAKEILKMLFTKSRIIPRKSGGNNIKSQTKGKRKSKKGNKKNNK